MDKFGNYNHGGAYMLYCSHCGSSVKSGEKYCSCCGKALDIEEAVTAGGRTERLSSWVIIFLLAAMSILGLVLVLNHLLKPGNNASVTQNEDGENNSNTELPDRFKEHFIGISDDFGFYAGSDQYIKSHMDISQVKETLGEPLEEISVSDDYYGDGIDLYYPGLHLAFRPFVPGGCLELIIFIIKSPDYTGPRGIRVGDTVESVLQRFPHDNLDPEVIDEFTNAGIAGENSVLFNHNPSDMADGYTYHSFGLLHYADNLDEIDRIELTCGILYSESLASLNLEIKKGLVEEIHHRS